MTYEFDFSKLTLADYAMFCTALGDKDNPVRATSTCLFVIGKTIDLETLSFTEGEKVLEAFAKEVSELIRMSQVWSTPHVQAQQSYN